MTQHIARTVLGLAMTFLFIGHAARIYEVRLIRQLDSIIYDARLRLTMPGKGDARIVILDIDEKSLGEIGRWPWSRNVSSSMEVLDALAQEELKDAAGFLSAYRQPADLRGKRRQRGAFQSDHR